MDEKTEYQIILDKIDKRKKEDPNFDGKKAEQLIRDSCLDALESMDENEKEIITRNITWVSDRVRGIGKATALELILATAYLPNFEKLMREQRLKSKRV